MKTKFNLKETWQFFKQVNQIFGIRYLIKLYSRKKTAVYSWCADPKYCVTNKRNPLDRIRDIFVDLHKAGKTDIAIAAINLLLESVDYETIPFKETKSVNSNIKDECLNNFQAMAKLQEVLLSDKTPEQVRSLGRKLKEQIDGTMNLFDDME